MRKGGIAFDHSGRPLPLSGDQVASETEAAFDDPNSKLLLCILERGEDIMVNILGEPSRATLTKLEEAVKSYRRIVRDYEKGQM